MKKVPLILLLAFILLLTPAQTLAVDTIDLLSYWDMETGSGNVLNDRTIYNNDGNLVKNPEWNNNAAIGSYSLEFNKTAGSYVNFTNINTLDILGNISINCWVNPSRLDIQQRIIGRGGTTSHTAQYVLQLVNNQLYWAISDSGSSNTADAVGTNSLSPNSWHMVSATYDASAANLTIYVNGSYHNSDNALSSQYHQTTYGLEIGAVAGGTLSFNGSIDECLIYQRVLKESEFLELWNGGSGIPYDDFTSKEGNYNFTFKKETDKSIITGTQISLLLVSLNNGINYNFTTIIGNIIANISADEYILKISAPGYTTRSGYINYPDANFSKSRTIYLLNNETNYNEIIINVIDSTSLPVENAIVQAKKYYGDIGQFLQVDEEISDNEGQLVLDLFKYNVLYEFSVIYDNETKLFTTPSFIKKDEITLQIDTIENELTAWNEYQDINSGLIYNDISRMYRGVFTNIKGNEVNVCLEINKLSANSITQINRTCASGVSGTILGMTLDNATSATYDVKLIYYDAENNGYVLDSEERTYYNDFDSSIFGLILQIILTFAAIGFALGDARYTLLSVPLSLIIGRLLYLNHLPYSVLIGILLVGIIILWGMGRK